ncbi:MAG: hypothetical protein EOL98_06060 [Negativicutes bacterium]|nr:hypothetical protein [Negativicutes bacterium]
MFIFIILFFFINNFAIAANPKMMPGIDKALLQAEFWLDKQEGEKILVGKSDIDYLNRSMQTADMPDLKYYPSVIGRELLKKYLQEYEIDAELFVSGKRLTQNQIAQLDEDRNTEQLPQEKKTKYGVVVERANLRTLPILLQSFAVPADREFDMWQETVVDPAEPVVILHNNKKNDFFYVQTRNYRGWLPAEAIAQTKRDNWLRYVEPESFAIVTQRIFRLFQGKNKWIFQMGSRIPTEGKLLLLPVRDDSGRLQIIKQEAEYGENLHEGYLPYTTNNLIRQAFKHLGSPYGWGGLKESVDCSSFVADVYRTVGIALPRNADEQEEANTGKKIDLAGYSREEKIAKISESPLGSAIFMPNHVMLYLGSRGGMPYVIHALGSYGAEDLNGDYQRMAVMEVVVSDVLLPTRSGDAFLERFASMQSYR